MKRIFALLALSTVLHMVAAQEKPAPPTQFSEVSKLKLLNAYRKAVIAQIQANEAKAAAQTAVDEYNALVPTLVKSDGLENGTTAFVDLQKDVVSPVAPKKPDPPKPEEVKK